MQSIEWWRVKGRRFMASLQDNRNDGNDNDDHQEVVLQLADVLYTVEQ